MMYLCSFCKDYLNDYTSLTVSTAPNEASSESVFITIGATIYGKEAEKMFYQIGPGPIITEKEYNLVILKSIIQKSLLLQKEHQTEKSFDHLYLIQMYRKTTIDDWSKKVIIQTKEENQK